METTHPRNEVCSYMFNMSLHDLRDLRARVRRLNVELPWGMLNTMNRQGCVRLLAVGQFGAQRVDAYEQQCREWDEDRAFVEYGVVPKKKNEKNTRSRTPRTRARSVHTG